MSRPVLSRQPPSPEYWHAESRSDSVVVMNIPGLLSRARDFDIDVSVVVAVPGLAQDAVSASWHELTVEVDGRQQWSRRVPSHNPGETDGLDYHLRLRLEAGQSVRVRSGCLPGFTGPPSADRSQGNTARLN